MNHQAGHNMVRLLWAALLALAMLTTSGVLAADAITGEWDMKMDFNGRESLATVIISEAADGTLAGTWGSSGMSNVEFANGKLTFTRTMGMGDRQVSMDFAGTLADGRIMGTLSSDRGDFAVSGMRPTPKLPVLGQWDIEIDVEGDVIYAQLIVSENEEGTLAGQWISDYGEHAVSDIEYTEGKLTLDIKSNLPDMGELQSRYIGTVEGHALPGAIVSEFGEIPANGKRVGTALIGTWQLTTTSDFGEMPGIMKVFTDLTGRYGTFGGEVPFSNLKLEGNQVTFSIERRFRDETFTSNFKGTLDGDMLKGQMTTQMGTNDVVGKKMVEAKPAVAAGGAFVGKWEFELETPGGTITDTLKLNEDRTGTYTYRDGDAPIKDLVIDNETISFNVTLSFSDMGDFTLEFKGALAEGTLEGEFITDMGGLPATGKKVQ